MKIGLIHLLALASSIYADNFTDKLEINAEEYGDLLRVHVARKQRVPTMIITRVSDIPEQEDILKIQIYIEKKLATTSRFFFADKEALAEGKAADRFYSIVKEGSIDQIETLLRDFYIIRDEPDDKEFTSELIFRLFDWNHNSLDIFQSLLIANYIKSTQLLMASVIRLTPSSSYTFGAIDINEPQSIQEGLRIALEIEPQGMGISMYAEKKGSIVLLNGETPDQFFDKDKSLKFNVTLQGIDDLSNEVTIVYNFTFGLQEQLEDQTLIVILIFVGVSVFVFLLVCCLMLYISHKENEERSKVKKEIEEGPKENINVLTNSIIEWTRDAPTKDSSGNEVLFNPYDKYSLKGPGKRQYGDLNHESSHEASHHMDKESAPLFQSRSTNRQPTPSSNKKVDILDELKEEEKLKDISKLNFSKAIYAEDNDKTMGLDFGDVSKIGKAQQENVLADITKSDQESGEDEEEEKGTNNILEEFDKHDKL